MFFCFFFPIFTIIRALGLNTSILYRIDKNVRVHDNNTISNNVLIISYYLEINMRFNGTMYTDCYHVHTPQCASCGIGSVKYLFVADSLVSRGGREAERNVPRERALPTGWWGAGH